MRTITPRLLLVLLLAAVAGAAHPIPSLPAAHQSGITRHDRSLSRLIPADPHRATEPLAPASELIAERRGGRRAHADRSDAPSAAVALCRARALAFDRAARAFMREHAIERNGHMSSTTLPPPA